jgi:hypothetical protein
MAMTAAQWNRFQQQLPEEDRMSYADYLAATGEAPKQETPTAEPAVTPIEVADNLAQVAEAAATAITPAISAAETARLKAIEDAANAEYERTLAAARAADLAAGGSPVNTDIKKGKLIGPQPIIGPGDSPDKIGGSGQFTEFKPMDNAAREAIFGRNPKTGKAYTDEESAALNAGNNVWGGSVGYQIDPRTGNLNILLDNGTVMTTGAKYQVSSKGFIIPQASSLPKGVGFDEMGNSYEPGQQMPGESLAQWVARLSQLGPGVLFKDGKAIQYDAGGKFYTEGEPVPQDFGTTPVNAASNMTTGTTSVVYNSSGNPINVNNAKIPTGTTVTTTYVDQRTGDTVGVLSNGGTVVLSQGTTLQNQRQSTIAVLTDRFNKYGLGSLAQKIRDLAIEGASEATVTLQLQETPEYQVRFAGNAERLKKGLQVLTPAEYLNLEDGYRQVLRAYGLKQFDTDDYVRQFISNDVSAAELSDRVVTAVQRVQNADPAVAKQLRDYYGIGSTDLVAYVLDPNQQLPKIQRQVATAEIGAAAARQGINVGLSVADQLAAQGVTQAEAQKGYATIADILPTAEKLSAIYGGVEAGYGLAEAEQEVFNSLAEAQRKRERLTSREIASFSGRSGIARTGLTQAAQGQF